MKNFKKMLFSLALATTVVGGLIAGQRYHLWNLYDFAVVVLWLWYVGVVTLASIMVDEKHAHSAGKRPAWMLWISGAGTVAVYVTAAWYGHAIAAALGLFSWLLLKARLSAHASAEQAQ